MTSFPCHSPILVKRNAKMIELAPYDDDRALPSWAEVECLISSLTCLEDSSLSHPSCTTILKVPPQPASNRRQRVAFDLTRNIIYEPLVGHTTSKDLQWYRQADYAVIKYRARCLAEHILHDDKKSKKVPYQQVLQDTMHRCEKAALVAPEDVLQNPLSQKERARLEKWLSVAPSRSGLEAWLVPARFESNRQRRSKFVQSMRFLSPDLVDRQLRIRQLSEVMSRPHRLYALAVAEAEAAAVAAQIPIKQK